MNQIGEALTGSYVMALRIIAFALGAAVFMLASMCNRLLFETVGNMASIVLRKYYRKARKHQRKWQLWKVVRPERSARPALYPKRGRHA